MPLSKDAIRRRIIRRAKKVLGECEQSIRDGEYWQSLPQNKGQAHKIDLEWFRVERARMLKLLKDMGEEV